MALPCAIQPVHDAEIEHHWCWEQSGKISQNVKSFFLGDNNLHLGIRLQLVFSTKKKIIC